MSKRVRVSFSVISVISLFLFLISSTLFHPSRCHDVNVDSYFAEDFSIMGKIFMGKIFMGKVMDGTQFLLIAAEKQAVRSKEERSKRLNIILIDE